MDYFFSKIKYKFSKSKAIIVALFLVLASAICVGSVGAFATAFAEDAQTQNVITVTFDAGDGLFEGETGKTYTRQFTKGKDYGTKYSHTPNVDDHGNKKGNYTNNLNLHGNDYVVNIPGAPTLHVKLTYGGESVSYDWVCAWTGNHPDYTASNNSSSAISVDGTQKFGGGNGTTVEFDVEGDTVTFAFRSDGSGCGNGYGYYAVVTSKVISTLTDGQEPVKRPTPAIGYYLIGWTDDANNKNIARYAKDLSDFGSDKDVTLYAVYADFSSLWNYKLDNTVNTISLTKYKGTETTYTVPAKPIIDGKEY